MNKEEILHKSRSEKTDEGMIQAENKGRQIGMVAFTLVFVFIVLFNIAHGQSNHAPFAMFWAFMAAESYPKYKFTGHKAYLVTTLAGAVAAVASLASFILTTIMATL